jgi:hypothetical protein
MKRFIAWTVPAAVISVGVLAASALDRPVSIIPQARAGDLETEAQCPRGDATLRGAYMSKGGGTVVGVGSVAFIGTVYFDGKGGITNPYTVSFAGTISRVVGKATYTVNSDCTATFTTTTDPIQHFDMRVSPDGSKIDYIETDPNTVISGSASRVNDRPAAWGNRCGIPGSSSPLANSTLGSVDPGVSRNRRHARR